LTSNRLNEIHKTGGRGGSNNSNGGGNNNNQDEDLSDGDWIGLFRARLRVDNSESHILTRRINGQATLDRRTGMVSGTIRLRTPRGVGEYDFRYVCMSVIYLITCLYM
jgi:hypothetical protein